MPSLELGMVVIIVMEVQQIPDRLGHLHSHRLSQRLDC